MRLTKGMIEAIIYMCSVIESDGFDNLQGFEDASDPERDTMNALIIYARQLQAEVARLKEERKRLFCHDEL